LGKATPNLNYLDFKTGLARDPVPVRQQGLGRSAGEAAIPKEPAELFNKALAVFYAWIAGALSEERVEPSIAQRYSTGAACDLI
jgi:hypothetical protein